MEKGFLNKVEDNVAVRIWSEKTQQEKSDSLTEGYSTVNMEICLIYSMSKWINTYFELLPSIGIPPIAASLLGRKRVDVFALSIYGLVIFPKVLGHINDAVLDLFYRLDKRVTPSLQDENVEWRAHWMILDEILYRCGEFNWVPLLGIWGVVGYATLLVLRQYRSRQFIPVMQGLAQCEFAYEGDNYKKKGINENIHALSQEHTWPIEEHLQVIPSELEIVKQDFEKKSSELGKRIEKLEEEKIQLGLDVDVQKLEPEKMRKGKIRLRKTWTV
ncbi:hypothetical protein Gotur_035270 [Gossypium turneri]